MKLGLTIVFGLLNITFSYGFDRNFLIYNNDTSYIYSSPLKENFRLGYKSDDLDLRQECFDIGHWNVFWALRNDSLFLMKIIPSIKHCQENVEDRIDKLFGGKPVFANWFNESITIPKGEYITGSNANISNFGIYEFEELIYFRNGKKTNIEVRDNSNLIKKALEEQKLGERIFYLKDTLLYYLNASINWEKIDDYKNIWCDDSYVLFYKNYGELKKVSLNSDIYRQSFKDKFFYFKMNKRCSAKIKKSLKKLSLNYIDPPKTFMLKIHLRYFEKLEINEIYRIYYYDKSGEI